MIRNTPQPFPCSVVVFWVGMTEHGKGAALSVTIEDYNGEKTDSFADCSSSICSCSDEDLRMGSRFFDFDLEVVERAFGGDRIAFEEMCKCLNIKLDQIERQIVRHCPGWPQEHRERVLDLFVHDRFLDIFAHPPKKKIENFNALCWKFLHDSIADAWRYYCSAKRNFKLEISADKKELESDEDFWDRHGTEICLEPSLHLVDLIERSDVISMINGYVGTLSPQKQQVYKLWKIGRSEREIASALNMTMDNVGCIVSRLKKSIVKKLCKKVG